MRGQYSDRSVLLDLGSEVERMGTALGAEEEYRPYSFNSRRTSEVSTVFESIVDEALASSPEMNLYPAPITVSEGVEVVYELSEE